MSEATELVELPPKETALVAYSTLGGLDPLIEQIRTKVAGTAYDMATAKGRAECASDAFKVAKSKAAIEKLGKALSAEYKEIPKKIDAERKRAFDELEALQKQVRQPLTEWEQAEEARIAQHKAAIEWFRLRAEENRDLDAAELRASLVEVSDSIVDESWEEFEAEAHRAKSRAMESLAAALAAREKSDSEQAELARLRAESEARRIKDEQERIAREAAEKATREAEAKAQAEREASAKREADAKAAAERRELELKLAAERAEREKVEAQQAAARAAAKAEEERLDAIKRREQAVEQAKADERQRITAQEAAVAAETKRREADKAHKGKVNRTALEAFVSGGMPEDCAKLAVTLIAKGAIPAVRITY